MSYTDWLYGYSNPFAFTDPSGQINCKKGKEYHECVARASLLNAKAQSLKNGVSAGYFQPVSSFADLVDLAYALFNGDISGMMWSLTNVLVGVDPFEYAVWKVGLEGASPRIKNYFNVDYDRSANPLFIGEQWLAYNKSIGNHYSELGDWNEKYFDGTSNQAFHFWYSVSTRYYNHGIFSYLANLIHDPYFLECVLGNDLKKLEQVPVFNFIPRFTGETTKEDYDLALKGVDFGSLLVWSSLTPNKIEPGAWIRHNLQNPGAGK